MTQATNSPFLRQKTSVRSIMLRTLAALIPGVATYVACFGAGILVHIALASVTALAAEALILYWRKKPIWLFVSDGSALITAWLLALSIPSASPWWLSIVGTLFAIVVVKHLYGGLGQNPFNPAMAAWCILIIAWPQMMSQWPQVGSSFNAQWQAIFSAPDHRAIDALVSATPLDSLRTALHNHLTVSTVVNDPTKFGLLGGYGWQWVALAYALGGLYLLQQRIITWHIPVAYLATLALLATLAEAQNAQHHAGALFHLFSGGAMLGAFFILTDPVSGATTPRGKLIFAGTAAVLTWLIRSFGAYPDGVAFSVLLMNIAVPLIDRYTQPSVFGHKK